MPGCPCGTQGAGSPASSCSWLLWGGGRCVPPASASGVTSRPCVLATSPGAAMRAAIGKISHLRSSSRIVYAVLSAPEETCTGLVFGGVLGDNVSLPHVPTPFKTQHPSSLPVPRTRAALVASVSITWWPWRCWAFVLTWFWRAPSNWGSLTARMRETWALVYPD